VASRRSVRFPSAPRALVPRATFVPGGEGPDGRWSVRLAAPVSPSPPLRCRRPVLRPTDGPVVRGPTSRPVCARGRRTPDGPDLAAFPSGCRFEPRGSPRRGDPSRPSDLAASLPFRFPTSALPRRAGVATCRRVPALRPVSPPGLPAARSDAQCTDEPWCGQAIVIAGQGAYMQVTASR
jgi:hypothetical protein